jgi:DDE superfamily endonuclease
MLTHHFSIGLSKNGWTSDFHCHQWFKDTFIPQVEKWNKSGKLIYDGHRSHEKYKLLHLAKEHNVILFSLPPHTTHKLQPLDVSVFGPFACAWIDRCNNYMEEYMVEIPRDQFVKHYMEVQWQTFKDTMICIAFQKTRIWPINHDAISNADFTPSIHTSSSACDVPDSYPVHADAWPNHQSWSDNDPNSADEDDNEEDDNDEQRRQAHQSVASSSSPTSAKKLKEYKGR